MKVTRIPEPALTASVILLRQGCAELDARSLLDALRTYSGPRGAGAAVEPGKALSVAQVAARLGCCQRTVLRLISAGKLPRVKLGDRAIRIAETALVRYVEG